MTEFCCYEVFGSVVLVQRIVIRVYTSQQSTDHTKLQHCQSSRRWDTSRPCSRYVTQSPFCRTGELYPLHHSPVTGDKPQQHHFLLRAPGDLVAVPCRYIRLNRSLTPTIKSRKLHYSLALWPKLTGFGPLKGEVRQVSRMPT